MSAFFCWITWTRISFKIKKIAFCFFGDFNGHHSEWLGFSCTNVHGVATCDFTALSGCTQLVRGSTYRASSILDLVISDVSDLCKVRVGCPIANSDCSHVGIVLD